MKTLIAVGGILAVLVGFFLVNYYGTYNYGIDAETVIDAEYKNMENILAQYSLKVTEAAQIPTMKKDDLKEVMRDAMSGRYGANGSQATFQWIKENYPGQVTDDLYSKISTIIEAGRNKFENAQTKFIDTKRVYVANLGKDLFLSKGWWLTKVHDFPRLNLDDYVIISSEHAQDAFKTKVDKGIKIR